MPEISRFLGIVIGMFYREHGVAHFHAVYGEHEISVEVESGLFTVVFLHGRSATCWNGPPFIRQNYWRTGSWPARANR